MQTLESILPKGTYVLNHVAICVGGSWDKIASGYSKVVDGQLIGMDFAPLVKEVIPAEVKTPLEKLHASFNWIKKNFRYTGVSLRQASIVPARPMQLLARRFGDCKDQATLLVGMLRELGIEAHVALVSAAGRGRLRLHPLRDPFQPTWRPSGCLPRNWSAMGYAKSQTLFASSAFPERVLNAM